MELKGRMDGVIVVPDLGEPKYVLIQKDGDTKWYELKKVLFGDFAQMLGADVVGAELPKIIKTQSL